MFNFRKSRKILIIDDEPSLLKSLIKTLEKKGYDVIAFEDPLLAIEHLKEEKIDLIISDLKIPKMDGIQLLHHVKTSYPNTPVILITAFATIDTAVMAVRWGAFGYLQKPFDIHKVREIVESALQLNKGK